MIYQASINVFLVLVISLLILYYQKQIEKIHEDYAKERKALLDRIMSNNIQEYKAASGQMEVKRSRTGNYLLDNLPAAKNYTEIND